MFLLYNTKKKKSGAPLNYNIVLCRKIPPLRCSIFSKSESGPAFKYVFAKIVGFEEKGQSQSVHRKP